MIAITGGGTGGHLVIARAIKEELNNRGMKPIYIGSTAGQDKSWFEHDTGFEKTYFLESQGVVNKKGLHKLVTLFSIIRSAFTCKTLFKKHQIKYVFSVGGYSAAPASFGALLYGIPLYIHEQNAIQGKLNSLLRPFSKAFFSSYDKNAIETSYPVSEAFFKIRRVRTHLKTIIFLGGSQGASFINALAQKLAPLLHREGIAIIHQTGKKEFEAMKTFYEAEGIPADVFDFSKEIPNKLASADFAISRSGASTLWELCAASVPALFIPFPHAAANHQYFNAKMLADQNLALILEQSNEIDASSLLEQIKQIDLLHVSERLAQTIHAGGAKEIVDTLLQNPKKEKPC
ncbi:UDP-N-acetylglucosamine--N-acetylmuramyl-(pentapeptide) pyrophosphoryl-undecaprenol N-acetylglucosamine transferase [Sulfurospirillum oryzae]|uniref:UDP-N-acetylglucosamine--N-acetylmuramyl- (pentapeptide) pyrophosphoryl-undecaprenol N-acetylglucosamine transferase n=1 Tax=Sulfurospirillum oryzae TaxID=2976535 RepID=UPI0021E785BF|nr:UDP-N-acetylglucosamine--N-acetylmuramyl-(pentapeptide) pyrophosphoryl-undecaprenol N-acetylglucosamine transferase [Sulfurospirillum oryzae]